MLRALPKRAGTERVRLPPPAAGPARPLESRARPRPRRRGQGVLGVGGGPYAIVGVCFAVVADASRDAGASRRHTLFAAVEASLWLGLLVGPFGGGPSPSPGFVPGLPHVTLIELRPSSRNYVPGLPHVCCLS